MDHGHANCMFVLGGEVKGGHVYGQWLGLEDQSNGGRDLALTTNCRSAVGEILMKHLGVRDLTGVFPASTTTYTKAVIYLANQIYGNRATNAVLIVLNEACPRSIGQWPSSSKFARLIPGFLG